MKKYMHRLKTLTKGGQKAVKMNYWYLILVVLLFSCGEEDNDKVQSDAVTGLTWVTVTGGTYEMGCKEVRDYNCYSDEKPLHFVTVGSFKMSAYEVTNGQYAKFLNAIGVDPSGTYSKGGQYENEAYIEISSPVVHLEKRLLM